jgi:pyruvate/2-oxoglutarate dehydrogenase complex dihydrolipoamide dehydrogenase (E3) component
LSGKSFDIVVIGATRSAETLVAEARRRQATVAWIRCFPEAREDEVLWRDLIGRARGLGYSKFESHLSRSLRCELGQTIWGGAPNRRGSWPGESEDECFAPDAGLRILRGRPRFLAPTSLVLESGVRIHSERIVVATGVSPRRPQRLFRDDRIVRDHRSMLRSPIAPRSVAIVGADWLGCEWASVFAATGAEVTLIDRRSRLLRALDGDFRTLLQGRLLGMGVDIVLEEEIAEIRRGRHGECRVRLSSGREELVEQCLLLAGQTANSSDLGLAEIGVQTDELGHISTDEAFRSSVPNVFAVGRVADPLGISPSSAYQARILVESMLNGSAAVPIVTTPWVLRSAVEIASCGLTAEACGALGVDVIIGKASSRAWDPIASHVAKVVVTRGSGLLVGAQIAGFGAAEAISHACDGLTREKIVADCVGSSYVESTAVETYQLALDAACHEWKAS